MLQRSGQNSSTNSIVTKIDLIHFTMILLALNKISVNFRCICQLILIFSHTNAGVESGLSVNGDILVKNLNVPCWSASQL